MDTIVLSKLALLCIIGTQEAERSRRQPVIATISLTVDLQAAGASDALADTVDYQSLENEILALAEQSRCVLLERLAQLVAECCLGQPLVSSVTVRLEKPNAPIQSNIALEITRTR
jgi:FolB domain-containing protein